MNEGLRGGDIGALLNPTSPGEFGKYMSKIVYEFSFYVVVITVLLNVIFGIIIDTFAQLREAHALKREKMLETCFICSVDRFTLDQEGGGFQRHVKKDHHMWSYLYLIIYVKEKSPTE